MGRGRKANSKQLSDEQLLGERGVSLVGRRFLDLGFPWHATNAPLDAGIDAHVEIRDPQTGIVSNTWLAVQVKARTKLEQENALTFEFTCTARDLDYWRRGNMPVLLVVVRPGTEQAWWVSVKDYFRDPSRANARKIQFDKQANALTQASTDDLLSVAQSVGSGAYFRAAPKRERLDTNLLEVTRLPAAIYRAETAFRDPRDLITALKKREEFPAREWILDDGAVYSVLDLRDGLWTEVCDRGTVESFDAREWAESPDRGVQRKFVWLMNECLRQHVSRMGMRWRKELGLLFFKATKDLTPRTKRYLSRQQVAKREVFREYRSKKDPSRILYYRHVGFEPRFQRFDGKWCLEINPSYLFTSDGRAQHPYHQEYLAKIKSIEGSGAVGNVVIMFAAMLRDQEGLFSEKGNYPHLGFGELLSVELDVGINDQNWAKQKEVAAIEADDAEDADAIASSSDDLAIELFIRDGLSEGDT
jgi:hypothetical protein